jgi:hypothetical protein
LLILISEMGYSMGQGIQTVALNQAPWCKKFTIYQFPSREPRIWELLSICLIQLTSRPGFFVITGYYPGVIAVAIWDFSRGDTSASLTRYLTYV